MNTAQLHDSISKFLTPEKESEMIQIMEAAVAKRRLKGAIPPTARFAVANCWGDYIGLNLDFLETLGDAEGLNGIYSRGVRGWTYIPIDTYVA